MIVKQYSLEQMPDYPFERENDLNKILFFDIETTGFAARDSYLYLIGCAYYEEDSFHIIQWFSEGPKEETLLLTSFFEFIKAYDVLIHYNGSGFDIPYLEKKCHQHKLDYTFEGINSLDIYKKILPYKKLLNLNSLRLQAIEVFLKIPRKDNSSGGDLIQVYQSFLGKNHYERLRRQREPEIARTVPSESEALLQQLLLHNEEDIRGLLLICPMLKYADLFEGPIRILQANVDGKYLVIRFEIASSLPVPVSLRNDLYLLSAAGNTATLSIPVYEGELKYFYDNYKDYYYLTAEDYAIHKSVAAFVDKDFKVKAKPYNCYSKKQGIFVPQFEALITPCFKMEYQDKLTFLEIHTDFLLKEEVLERYVKHMMGQYYATKKDF